jgi:hypothetical protein
MFICTFFDDTSYNNFEKFQTDSSLHCVNMRQENQLYWPITTLSCIQNGITYSSIKIFSSLYSNILKLHHDKSNFKVALQWYLIIHILYSLKDCFSHTQDVSHKS